MIWSNFSCRFPVASSLLLRQYSQYKCKTCFKISDYQKHFYSVLVKQKPAQQTRKVHFKLSTFPSVKKWSIFICQCIYGNNGTVKFFSTSTNRFSSAFGGKKNDSNKTGLIYIIAVFIFMLGGAYAGVPLYKVFCQATGLGGQAVKGHDTDKIETMEKVDRKIVVRFNADVASSMRWNFRPQQSEVTVCPGETALAFYTAKNPTDKAIIGISTYNVLPYEAGQYFNKIQCFCFEEQRLNPNEQAVIPFFFSLLTFLISFPIAKVMGFKEPKEKEKAAN